MSNEVADPTLPSIIWWVVNNQVQWASTSTRSRRWSPLHEALFEYYATFERLVLWVSLGYQP